VSTNIDKTLRFYSTALLIICSAGCILFSPGVAQAWQFQQVYIQEADSLFEDALSYYNEGLLNEARSGIDALLNMPRNQRTTAAEYLNCRIAVDEGDHDKALSITGNFLKQYPESRYVADIHILRAETQYKSGYHFLALDELISAINQHENESARSKAAEMFANIFIPELPENIIREYESIAKDSEVAALIQLKYAQHAVNTGDYQRGLEIIDRIDRNITVPEVRKNIENLRSLIEGDLEKERYIAVLLPFSGEYSGEAVNIYRGIKFAIDNYNESAVNPLRLKPVDTRGVVSGVPGLVKSISEDRSVLCIIGPLVPEIQVLAVSLAEMYKIPIILPGNSSGIAVDDHEYGFKQTGSPESEGRALAQFAVNELNLSTFAILSPISELGERIANSFALEVADLGGDVLVHEWYYPGAYDFSQQYSHIRRIGYDLMMADSLRLFIRDTVFESLAAGLDSMDVELRDSLVIRLDSLNNAYMDSLSILQLDSLKYIFQDSLTARRREQGIREIDSLDYAVYAYDAFFIPVTDSEELDYIVNQLAFYNFRTSAIGNNRWYDIAMLDRISPALRFTPIYISSDYYIDDFFEPWAGFRDMFRAKTSATPGLDEIYGYDSMQFVLKAIRNGARTRNQVFNRLKEIQFIENSPRGSVRFGEFGKKSNWMILQYRQGMLQLYDSGQGGNRN